MRRVLFLALLAALVADALVPLAAQANKPAAASVPIKLKVGDPAPDFTLKDQNGKDVALKSFQGKKTVVLAFYIFAFTGG